MNSIAHQLGTKAVTANKFVHLGAKGKSIPLVIDAFDELAKADSFGAYKLLSQAKATNPTHVYLSSRSSEWDSAATSAFKDVFGCSPLVVRLSEFNEVEQRAIFDHYVPDENFTTFQAEVARFDLDTLLPNPQFLKLFADSFIESDRRFIDKRSIFALAIERLAKEVNLSVTRIVPRLSTKQKVDISAEVFAKLLLSGAEGVSVNEATENQMYPLLEALFDSSIAANGILATRLFKPGEIADQHRPVHKIVAEYCAADYLTKRIADPADFLTLSKCLPIIAPNSAVRDELRGLLGWMAALGNRPIQEAAIELDPYAVLANGDPSQLAPSSKRLLIKRLKEIEIQDPYFRRGDSWRRFSVAGFFTPDVVEEIKPLLLYVNDGHLRDLVLELLTGSPAIGLFRDELRQLILMPTVRRVTRILANSHLLEIDGDGHCTDVGVLISQASIDSLSIAAETINTLGAKVLERQCIIDFFRASANLYPGFREKHRGAIGSLYFVKKAIQGLDLATIEWLLGELTKSLACRCGKNPYECDCRTGISKIIGSILDRYFELARPPFDPKGVWEWVKGLHFHGQKGGEESKAVQVLQQDVNLRQGILAHVFAKMTDHDEIFNTRVNWFGWHSHSHSGLNFHLDDTKFLCDFAFDNDNPELWVTFLIPHQYFINSEARDLNPLRRYFREQALAKPTFMSVWARENRGAARHYNRDKRMWGGSRSRGMERRKAEKQAKIHAKNINYVQDNRELVENGRQWNCLVRFAELALSASDNIEREFGEELLVRNALRNCLEYIAPHVPDVHKLAELQCASQRMDSEIILFAACIEIMRANGNLNGVDQNLLIALKTNIHMEYRDVSSEEHKALESEVNRLIFPGGTGVEAFLRRYLEPQLLGAGCAHPELWLLRGDEVSCEVRALLSIEWLKRYSGLAFGPLDTLFEIAAQYANRSELEEAIKERCTDLMSDWPSLIKNEEREQRRIFWLVRAWYFLDEVPNSYWDCLKADKEIVFALDERSGQMNRRDYTYWPKLKSRKVESILDAFFDKWPKVHLPSSWGTGSPKGECAYRFLVGVIWLINSDDPEDAIPVLGRLLCDSRFADLHNSLKSIYASQLRNKALWGFEPPSSQEIVKRLDCDEVVTVGDLRQLVIQELQDFQKAIDGGEYNSADRFYEKGARLNEVGSTEIIAERLNLRLEPQGIVVTPEHQLKSANRSDFTVTKIIGGKRKLLVTEVKGQWHRELYTAASAQLYERYAIHQDAEHQGIYLVIWFGQTEMVAGRKLHKLENATQLKAQIDERLPSELKGLIDVFVLDVSKP
tara:strand:- start:149 stop:4054 length:3906 start_codon:yes stop_codon:yes gene_type:complete